MPDPTTPPRSPPGRRRSRPPAEPVAPAAGYTTREVADVLDLPTSRLHAWAHKGLLRPSRGPRNQYVFSFRDLAVLRAAEALLDADVSTRRVGEALARIQELLPAGRPLSAVQLTALGGRVLVQEGERLWDPDTGQMQLPLEDPGGTSGGEAVEDAAVRPLRHRSGTRSWGVGAADAWFERGVALEDTDPEEARGAYRRALEVDPGHADAYVNLGRLLHEAGSLDEAELQYRAAVSCGREPARAWYNLGVLLEDRDRPVEALRAYGAALTADPALAVAHWNAARLHERRGRDAEALRHLATYKRLMEGRQPGG